MQPNTLDKELMDKIKTMEQQLAAKEREQFIVINNLQRKNRELKNQFAQTQRSHIDVKKEVIQLQSKNDHFKIQIENTNIDLNELNGKLQALANDQEFYQQEIKLLKNELKQDQLTEQEVIRKNETIKKLNYTINELEKQLRLLKLNQQQQQNTGIYRTSNSFQQVQTESQQQICRCHQQQEEITIPVYVPIIEQTKIIESPQKHYQVERITQTTNSTTQGHTKHHHQHHHHHHNPIQVTPIYHTHCQTFPVVHGCGYHC